MFLFFVHQIKCFSDLTCLQNDRRYDLSVVSPFKQQRIDKWNNRSAHFKEDSLNLIIEFQNSKLLKEKAWVLIAEKDLGMGKGKCCLPHCDLWYERIFTIISAFTRLSLMNSVTRNQNKFFYRCIKTLESCIIYPLYFSQAPKMRHSFKL